MRRIERPWVKQAYAQSKHMERITGRRFTPLLVFSHAHITKPGARHRGVTVLPAELLEQHLRAMPQALDPAAVADIAARLNLA